MSQIAAPAGALDRPGALFHDARAWGDMDAWHRRVGELRREEGMVLVDEPGYAPYWALLRHADVFAVSRDNAGWLNTANSVLGPDADWQAMLDSGMPPPCSLVQLDGQKHRDHRQVTNDWFKPAAVKTRQPRIDELADLFVERMRELDGRCDFAKDIAQPFTLRVIMDIYGVPEEDEPLMMDLTQGIFGANDPEFLGDAADPGARVMGSVMQFIQYFNEITQDRRACPADDLASVIANGTVDGEPMGDVERLWYYIIVATAGHDTTSFALAGGMERFCAHPDQLWALRDQPELLPSATDEVIRYTTPVRHFLRWAAHDQVLNGVEIPAGGRVLLSYPSANRDEAVFQAPDTFDVRRPDADKLISFGLGAHFCLGSQFARREVRTMLQRLSTQLEHIELAGDVEHAQSHFVSGVKHLPIEYRFR
jgi:cytochrome P450